MLLFFSFSLSLFFFFSLLAPGNVRSFETQIFMDKAAFGLGNEESGSAALLIFLRE